MNRIVDVLKVLFLKWKLVLIFPVIAILLIIKSIEFRSDSLLNKSFEFSLYLYIPLIVFLIIEIIRKKWIAAFLYLLEGGILFFTLIVISFADPDFYADDLKIPENLELNKPIELESLKQLDSLRGIVYPDLRFDLGGDCGMYQYFLWYSPPENGNVYLKVYEITQNDRLSEPRLSDRTMVKVKKGQSNCINKDFTIYEGEWGQYYGARIEVWFIPDNNNEEYKVLEKNYIVDGWTR